MQQFKSFQKSQRSKRQLESRLALKNLTKATREWGIDRKTTLDLIGLSSLHQMGQWNCALDDITLTDEQIETVTYLMCIHQSLNHHLSRSKDIEIWLKTNQTISNTIDNISPLDYLCQHSFCVEAARTVCDLITQKYSARTVLESGT
jgi:hypothetical protein